MIGPTIDSDKFSAALRNRALDVVQRRVLITNFSGSQQEQDLSLPTNCGGLGRIHHFRRNQGLNWPGNPLPIEPAQHFFGEIPSDSIRAQVFQNAVCNWRCWYCFVDFDLLSGNRRYSQFKSATELLNLYLREADVPRTIDLSGGQPDLVPEWTLWMLDEIRDRGLSRDIYVWSDDNLSNDYLWRFLEPAEICRMAAYRNYGRVGCFKGFDAESFSFNTSADALRFDQQFVLMRRLVDAGFDVYGYVTLTSLNTSDLSGRIKAFVDRMQNEIHEIFPLRVIPLRIEEFTPMRNRLGPERSTPLQVQEEAVALWMQELTSRFGNSELEKKIYQHRLYEFSESTRH